VDQPSSHAEFDDGALETRPFPSSHTFAHDRPPHQAIPLDNLADEHGMLLATQRSIGEDLLLIVFLRGLGLLAGSLFENSWASTLAEPGNPGYTLVDYHAS
jgi:hypothetical protein